MRAPTFRFHPAIGAQAMATIAVLNPGRTILGVGTGESLNEVPATGMEWPKFKERFGRLREAIELMRRLWTEERFSLGARVAGFEPVHAIRGLHGGLVAARRQVLFHIPAKSEQSLEPFARYGATIWHNARRWQRRMG